mmetsp:Transcript_64551/g.166145  ORF Transcript_64551/g.166145 Transcript_64551/m.166145 type:complete len:482 (-) Transcript_64551:1370-2815(-)
MRPPSVKVPDVGARAPSSSQSLASTTAVLPKPTPSASTARWACVGMVARPSMRKPRLGTSKVSHASCRYSPACFSCSRNQPTDFRCISQSGKLGFQPFGTALTALSQSLPGSSNVFWVLASTMIFVFRHALVSPLLKPHQPWTWCGSTPAPCAPSLRMTALPEASRMHHWPLPSRAKRAAPQASRMYSTSSIVGDWNLLYRPPNRPSSSGTVTQIESGAGAAIGSLTMMRQARESADWLVPSRTSADKAAAACSAEICGRAPMRSSPLPAFSSPARLQMTESGFGHVRCIRSKTAASSCCSCGINAPVVGLFTHCTGGNFGATFSSAARPLASLQPTSAEGNSCHSAKRLVACAAAGRSQCNKRAGPSMPRCATSHGDAPQSSPAGASGTANRARSWASEGAAAPLKDVMGSATVTASSGRRNAAADKQRQRPGCTARMRCTEPFSGSGSQPCGSTAQCSRVAPRGSFSCVVAMTKRSCRA